MGVTIGIKITGYVVKNDSKDLEWIELGSRSPQDPQVDMMFFEFSKFPFATHRPFIL